MKRQLSICLAAAGLLLNTTAHAHYLWLEQGDKSAMLYYGDFESNFKEVSPGKLDNMLQPSAMRLSAAGDSKLNPKKTATGYAIPAITGKGESLIVEVAQLPVAEKKEGDKTTRIAPTRAARYVSDFTARPAKLTLDVVPAGRVEGGAVELQVLFKNVPLTKTKVGVDAASGWSQEHKTDDQGKFKVTLPWRGTYVVVASHIDATAGERGGAKYDLANYRTTLTLEQPDGMASPPAPAARLGVAVAEIKSDAPVGMR